MKHAFYVFCITFLLSLFGCPAGGKAQSAFRILFYNTENSFDTTDDPEKQDDEYLPESGRHWTRGRYYTKMQQIAKVITAAGEWGTPALVGLCEVENDSVLHRLVNHTPLKAFPYRYCLTHGSDPRGINIALLYQRDRFAYLGHTAYRIPFRDPEKHSRDLLHVWGKVSSGDTLDVFVCHFPSRYGGEKGSESSRWDAASYLHRLCDSLSAIRQHPTLIVMGDFNDTPRNKSLRFLSSGSHPLTNLFADPARLTQPGSNKYQGNWLQLDQILLSPSLLSPDSPIHYVDGSACLFDPSFLFTEDKTYRGKRPRRTYYGYKYEGGFSDHLPVRADLIIGTGGDN